MKTFSGPNPKPKKRPKKKHRGMARPDEPLAHYCEIGRAGVCDGRVVHRHHQLMRSQGGTDEASNTLDCCEPCHTFAHHNRAIAKAHGWIVTRPVPEW